MIQRLAERQGWLDCLNYLRDHGFITADQAYMLSQVPESNPDANKVAA